jgi:S1-C subfamily serine protease
MWHRQTRPMALGILSALVALLAVCLTIQCTGCSPKSPLHPRDVSEQYDAAVEISALCVSTKDGQISGWYGSGVIVSPTIIFTAAHVATAPTDNLCAFSGKTRAGQEFNLLPRVVDDKLDLASMDSDSVLPYVQGLPFGPIPHLGDEVCSAPAHPHRRHQCGEVQPNRNTPGDLDTDMIAEPGNSGGGAWDDKGQLIGIVVHMYFCFNGQICGSHISTLEGHLGELFGGK